MSLSNNFPTIAPSLNLSFALTKALDPRITFTRTTTATYYDGVTTAKAEENLAFPSQDFSTSWSTPGSGASVTTDTETAPDGSATADTLTATAGLGDHYVARSATLESSKRYVLSLFAKAGTNNYIQFAIGTQTTTFANFDITAGAGATGTSGGVVSTSITSVGNDWYRCVMVFDNTNGNSINFALADSDSMGRLADWTAAGTETVYLWGAQLEQRSAVSSYTPTTTQPITNYIPVLQTAASGVARFDHNPTTGESLGLLVEEQRTNLLPYSAEFDNAAWTKNNSSITADTIVAPDGTLTGDKLVENTSTAVHATLRSVSVSAGSNSFSVYLKAAERTFVQMVLVDSASSNFSAYFNLSTGQVGTVAGSGTTTSITPVGNGWYRCSITATTAAGNLTNAVRLASANGTNSYLGDGYSGVYIWGAQLEEEAFPTSYIATTSASVTRNADVATMTGTNFSSWFNNAEGTMYAEATTRIPYTGTNLFPRLAEVNRGGSTSDAMRLSYGVLSTQTDFRASVFVNSVSQYGVDSDEANGGKQILAYKVDDFSSASNGTLLATDTSGTLPVVDSLFLGSYTATGLGNINGTIKKIAFYPSRLANAQLQALTS